MTGTDESGQGTLQELPGLFSFVKRPYCWIHGHEYTGTKPPTTVSVCSRCGISGVDSAMDAAFLTLLIIPFVAIGVWIRDAWRKIRD